MFLFVLRQQRDAVLRSMASPCRLGLDRKTTHLQPPLLHIHLRLKDFFTEERGENTRKKTSKILIRQAITAETHVHSVLNWPIRAGKSRYNTEKETTDLMVKTRGPTVLYKRRHTVTGGGRWA